MFFAIFHQDKKRVCMGKRGTKGRYSHRFGGPASYTGLQAFSRQPPVHVLFRLNMADPLVGVRMPTTQWLPLLCAIRYGACALGYRVVSNDAVEILHQAEKKAWRGFPSDDYPAELPGEHVQLRTGTYNPANPRSALFFGGVFGYDALTPKQFTRLVKFVEKEGMFDPAICEQETAEEYLREGAGWPFVQGPPNDGCPNTSCRLHGVERALRVFALFREDDTRKCQLWGSGGQNLQIIYQICPSCSTILTTNQCT